MFSFNEHVNKAFKGQLFHEKVPMISLFVLVRQGFGFLDSLCGNFWNRDAMIGETSCFLKLNC